MLCQPATFIRSCLSRVSKVALLGGTSRTNYIGLLAQSIRDSGKQWVIVDHPKNLDEPIQKLSNITRDLFDTVNSFNLIKLKIVATSIEECIDTVWFAYSKTLLNNNRFSVKLSPNEIPTPTVEYIYENMDTIIGSAFFEVASVQELDKDVQHEYDYIIKFKDLFDVEYIKDLYKKINGRDMDYARSKAIEKNIEMQYRLSKSEFYPMFKDKLSIIHTLF